MKSITLHPLSILAGLALAGLLFLATGAAQAPVPTRTVFVGEVPADWWTYIELSTAPDGTPIASYTIPLNRHFVVTHIEYPGTTPVRADGIDVRAPLRGVDTYNSGVPNGTRVPLPPGALLTVDYNGSGSWAKLWGYLEPVR